MDAPQNTPLLRGLLSASTLALVAPVAAAQWQRVQAPELVSVTALSAPLTPGPVVASLETPGNPGLHGSGFARSPSEGSAWRRFQAQRTPLLIDIEQHPGDSNVLWGANYSVWKSADAGHSWSEVYTPQNAVQRIAVDPSAPELLYGVGYVIVPAGDFHRSMDGGITWQSTNPFFLVSHNDIAVDPEGVVLLASGNGINRSTDGGDTFVNVASGLLGRRIAVASGASDAAWCIAWEYEAPAEVWSSQDSGRTWTQVAAPATELAVIAAHPDDASRAWALGPAGAFWTADGGATWNAGTGLSPIADLRSICSSPFDASTLLAGGEGGFGGIWRSLDGGQSWAPSSTGLATPIPEFTFSDSEAWAVGLGVPARRTDDTPWQPVAFSDGTQSTASSLAVHPLDPGVVAWVQETFQWYVPDRLILTVDDGSTWSDITPAGAQNHTWEVRRLDFDSSGTLHVGCQYGDLYSTTDLGQSWEMHAGPWGVLEELHVDPHDDQRLFAIDREFLYRSPDQGATWTTHAIDDTFVTLPSDLFANPLLPDELFVLAGNPERSLFQSNDGGTSWTAIGAGLPPSSTWSLAVDPSQPSRQLVGTPANGVYVSVDGGLSFAPDNEGLSHPAITTVAIEPQSGRAWVSDANGGLYARILR